MHSFQYFTNNTLHLDVIIYKIMFPIIDFRNGRYQGQTINHIPHGVGIFIDRNFMFCLAEWISGEVKGQTLVIFPSGRIFCGTISFRKPEQLCTYELAEDHVQVITFARPRQKGIEKLAAIMPLLQTILEIDNGSSEREAHVLQEYRYSDTDEESNLHCLSKILNLDKNGPKVLSSHRNCVQFFEDYFLGVYPDTFQFLISENKNKKEYFIGLRGNGLGVKIEPIQELGLHSKKTQRVYLIRGMGFFTKQNQMRDIGLKTLDNVMKGIIYEEGVYSLPETVIKYEPGHRPQNCFANFHNYLKRSLFYRDKVLATEYIYELDKFVGGFNKNLRKVQTEKLAQFTIENPNNSGEILEDIERRRREKEKEKQLFKRSNDETVEIPNPYHPSATKYTNPEFNLQRARDQIYRSVSKKKGGTPNVGIADYHNVQYVDPNYRKVTRDQRDLRDLRDARHQRDSMRPDPYLKDERYRPSRQRRRYREPTIEEEPIYPAEDTTPRMDGKYKSSYRYLEQLQDNPRPNRYDSRSYYPRSNNYISGDNAPRKYSRTPDRYEDASYVSPSKQRAYYPNSQKKSYLDETDNSDIGNERGGRYQPRYSYYDNYKDMSGSKRTGISPGKERRKLLTNQAYE